jgi:capsular exopolysaccharide synthesis family protein
MIRKQAIWVILGLLVGVMGAWLTVSGRPVAYTSSAAIDVEPRIISGSVPVTPNLATEEKVATSGDVLGAAARVLDMSPGHLSAHVAVSVSGTSTILSIACTMPEPAQAQQCASVVTETYIKFRNETGASKGAQARDPLNVTLVSPATLPISPAGTKKVELLSIGAFLGFLLGIGGAYVRDRADDRVRDRADLSRNVGGPALAEIPRVRRRTAPAGSAFARAPSSRAAEAYRFLRARIGELPRADTATGRVILVTGPRGGEGSTSVSGNLAAALAQAGDRVMLVDGDVRNSSLSALHDVAGKPGLTDLVAGRSSLGEVAQDTGQPRLVLIPAGQSRTNPADALEPSALADVFASLSAASDTVVVDSGPVLAVSEPTVLASVSNVIVVVANARRTTRTDVRAIASEIGSAGGRHVVGVLNHVPPALARISLRRRPARGSQPDVSPLAAQRRPDDEAVGAGRTTVEAPDQ